MLLKCLATALQTFAFCQARYPRQCPLAGVAGQRCDYVAPSSLAFRRHLIVRHGVELVSGRGPTATEVFVMLSEEEASRRRYAVSHRQGGRSQRRAGRQDVRQAAPPAPESPSTSTSDQPSTAASANLPTQAVSFLEPLASSSSDPLWEGRPAGYRSSETSLSSLSEGGNTNDIDLDDLGVGDWAECFPDLSSVRSVTEPQYRPPSPFRDVGVQCGITRPRTISTGSDARPMPGPAISPPSVDSAELAARASVFLRAAPEAPVDMVADDILRTFPPGVPSSEARAVHLALEFGAELLRNSADQLAREISARFGQIEGIQPEAVLAFVFDELGVWRRRPALPRRHHARNIRGRRH